MALSGYVAERLLLVFAKEPTPGHVKTRLLPALSAEQAARCQCAFTSDVVARLRSLCDARVVLCATPDGQAPWLARRAAEMQVELVWQGRGDLGERLKAALGRAIADGARVAIVGTDSPDLPLEYVVRAIAALERSELVLGPCADGGYYLVGCSGAVAPIFDRGVEWGSARVLAQTLERASAAGVRPHVLPEWYDVDHIDGLRRLTRRLREVAGLAEALPATRRLVDELTREGVEL